jgi:dUTPase
LVFVKMDKPDKISITDDLTTTDRGSGGFGSTGK